MPVAFLNVVPWTGSEDQISTTVASVLAEYFKTSERTIFWNEDLRKNVDPFPSLEGGFFTADWDFKVRVLRVNCTGPHAHVITPSA